MSRNESLENWPSYDQLVCSDNARQNNCLELKPPEKIDRIRKFWCLFLRFF